VMKKLMRSSRVLNEYFDQKVPLFAEQGQIMAMFLESENQATEITARLESGESFTELAGEFSLDSFSKENTGDLGWRVKDVLPLLLGSSIPEEYAFDSEAGVLSQPLYDEAKTKRVGYWLIKVTERQEAVEEVEGDEERAHIQAILLGSEAEAQGVTARLEAGEDFAALAEELSRHESSKANDGDMGWLTRSMIPAALGDFAFSSELETLSEPIRDEAISTIGGYWLVEVLDKDANREVGDEDRDLLKNTLLNEWVSSLRDDPENNVEDYLDEAKISWAIAKATEELEQ